MTDDPLYHPLEGEKSCGVAARRLIAEGQDRNRRVVWTRAGKPAFSPNDLTLGYWADLNPSPKDRNK